MSRTLHQFGEPEQQEADRLITLAIQEDLGAAGDITSNAMIPASARGSARVISRSSGVLAGLPIIERIAAKFELEGDWQPNLADGDRLERGTEIGRLAGRTRGLLALERTALNFLQRLSGIASLTSQFVAAVAGTGAAIYDTRKTTPGWRTLEKYAVRCGGGRNHRLGLYDAVLIKDNHLAWLHAAAGPKGSCPIPAALAAAVAKTSPGTTIEVEVDSLEQMADALACSPDVILVDNFEPAQVALAVQLRDLRAPRVQIEVSGGVNLSTVRSLAQAGVNRISVGALTHSAPALDLSMDFEWNLEPDGMVAPTVRPRGLGS